MHSCYLIGVIFSLVVHVPHVGNDDDCFLRQNMVLNVGVALTIILCYYLSSIFLSLLSQLNKVVSDPRPAGFIGDGGSRESKYNYFISYIRLFSLLVNM